MLSGIVCSVWFQEMSIFLPQKGLEILGAGRGLIGHKC